MRTESEDDNDLHNVIHIDKGNTFISPGANCSFGIASFVQKPNYQLRKSTNCNDFLNI